MSSSELVSAVDQERARVHELEGALAPRRQAEAATLAALERDLAKLDARRAEVDARARDADDQRLAFTRELKVLEAGLTAERRTWVRLGVPVVASVLLLVALLSVGLADGRSWWLVTLCGALGFLLGRRSGRDG